MTSMKAMGTVEEENLKPAKHLRSMVREVLEESGLIIQNPKYCGLLMFPNFKGNDWYVFVFATKFE
jgi:hypothetical protein